MLCGREERGVGARSTKGASGGNSWRDQKSRFTEEITSPGWNHETHGGVERCGCIALPREDRTALRDPSAADRVRDRRQRHRIDRGGDELEIRGSIGLGRYLCMRIPDFRLQQDNSRSGVGEGAPPHRQHAHRGGGVRRHHLALTHPVKVGKILHPTVFVGDPAEEGPVVELDPRAITVGRRLGDDVRPDLHHLRIKRVILLLVVSVRSRVCGARRGVGFAQRPRGQPCLE